MVTRDGEALSVRRRSVWHALQIYNHLFTKGRIMIARKDKNDYAKVSRSAKPVRRMESDPDIAFSEMKLYVLDENEWFDPQYRYHGPAAVTVNTSGGMYQVHEYHVNDPAVWAWVRRCIAEGHLNADTIDKELINNEKEITYKEG